MRLRAALHADAPEISSIINAIVRDTLITFTTREKTIEDVTADIDTLGAAFQVAQIAGEVVGFACYGPFRAGPGYAATCEHSIHLAQGARGHGVGRALMERLEQVARADGKHVMVAGISAANPGAVAFHRKLGFTKSGHLSEVGCKQGQWLDLILMQKLLRADNAPDTDRRSR
ncbi:N-acetyltransferase family protein [Arenibacterium sp. CAU 1754]